MGFELEQRLGRQDMLHFAGSDSKSERSKRTMGCGVRIATNDRHAGLGKAIFRSNDVDNSLADVTNVVQRHAELFAILSQRLNLLSRDRIGDRQRSVAGRNVVIGRRKRFGRLANGPASNPKPLERLRAGHFVDQVQVDVQDRWPGLSLVDNVSVPDLVQERGGSVHRRAYRGRWSDSYRA